MGIVVLLLVLLVCIVAPHAMFIKLAPTIGAMGDLLSTEDPGRLQLLT